MDNESSEPLHLTPENRECIRRLVRLITPNFEREVWERADLTAAKVRAMEKAMREAAQMQAAQQQQNWPPSLTAANTNPFAHSASPMFRQLAATGTANIPITPGPIYQSIGTGFTPYGPLDTEQGLQLVGLAKVLGP